MRKLIALILISIIVTGCSIRKLDDHSLSKIVDVIINNSTKLANVASKGYKYYLPQGVGIVDNTSYNEKLASSTGNYYLYVDIVSYYYKKASNYTINNRAYFTKELDYNGKKGYLEINRINNRYFVEMMYNYAKIETFVYKEDLTETVINISYILSSIKFNDAVIKILFDKNILNYNESKVIIFEPKGQEENFLDYVNQYDTTLDDNAEIIMDSQGNNNNDSNDNIDNSDDNNFVE